jgi:hypothetical protein
LSEHPRSERRRAARTRTRIRAVASTSLGIRHKVVISDLSVSGCAIVTAGDRLAPGAAYGLKIEGLETLGSTAAWSDGQSAGLLFENELHPAVSDFVAARHPAEVE